MLLKLSLKVCDLFRNYLSPILQSIGQCSKLLVYQYFNHINNLTCGFRVRLSMLVDESLQIKLAAVQTLYTTKR